MGCRFVAGFGAPKMDGFFPCTPNTQPDSQMCVCLFPNRGSFKKSISLSLLKQRAKQGFTFGCSISKKVQQCPFVLLFNSKATKKSAYTNMHPSDKNVLRYPLCNTVCPFRDLLGWLRTKPPIWGVQTHTLTHVEYFTSEQLSHLRLPWDLLIENLQRWSLFAF